MSETQPRFALTEAESPRITVSSNSPDFVGVESSESKGASLMDTSGYANTLRVPRRTVTSP